MPSLDTVLAVVLAGLTLSASPGPSMLYVLSRTIQQGRRGGIASSLGLAAGGMLLALLAAYGLAALAAQSPLALRAIRLGGAGYLFWLGALALRAAWRPPRAEAQPAGPSATAGHAGPWRLFWQGLLVELTNPKTLLFFVAFMTPFAASHTSLGLLLLGSLIPLTAVPADLLCIFAGAWAAQKARRRPWIARASDCAAALVLLGLGVVVLLL